MQRPAPFERPLTLLAWLIALVLLAAMSFGAGQFAADRARRDLGARTTAATALHAAVWRSELEKHRSLPNVLAEDSDVRDILGHYRPAAANLLNIKLERLANQTRAAVVYILDRHGTTIAASNWRLPTSFIGANYGFRPYFRNAVEGQAPEHFALGVVSRHPGLFFARRVTASTGEVLGVAVVKVEFDALEREWRASGDPAFVTDPHGVVLVTSIAAWRFHTLGHLTDEERLALAASHQFGDSPLTPLPLDQLDASTVRWRMGDRDLLFTSAATPAFLPSWTLRVMTRADPAIAAARNTARITAALLGTLALLVVGILMIRRRQVAVRISEQARVRAELERSVELRTSELRAANERLILEMEERRRAELSRQQLQDDLVQANKLATLGQIAAGVAHEINQPVAAIRSFADNAMVLLSRGESETAGTNLATIARLTDKIGLITGELRAFSRKTSGKLEPTSLETAIAGALLLTGSRSRQQGVELTRDGDITDVAVLAERVRLEQVLVNLLQNALEALEGRPDGQIVIGVEPLPKAVRITITDNGPGLDPATIAGLFTPFVTTKKDGLGLGLVISRDLVSEFGGELTLEERRGASGACFAIILKRVDNV